MNRRRFFDSKIETCSKSSKSKIQLGLLNKTLASINKNSVFYKKKYSGLNIKKLTDLKHLQSLPLTEKNELTSIHYKDNICVDIDKIVQVHFSSGTTTKPVPSFFTKKDIELSNKFLASTWYMQGIRDNTVVAMLPAYGLFSAGLINHYAIQNIGAFILPISTATTEEALRILTDFEPTFAVAISSYYLYLIEKMKSNKRDLKFLQLKTIVGGGEPFTEPQRLFIEKHLNVNMYDQYGICEINTGLAGECTEKTGLHLLDMYAYPEIIDPKTLEVLPEGSEGELVLTTLQKEASPLVRYRTGDITSITYKKCKCGRTTPRIARITRRTKNTIYYKGLKIDTDSIKQYLQNQHDLIHPFIWNLHFTGNTTKTLIKLSIIPNNTKNFDELSQSLESEIHRVFNIRVVVEQLDPSKRTTETKIKNFSDDRI